MKDFIRICPNCFTANNYLQERRPNGNSKCKECGHKDKTNNWIEVDFRDLESCDSCENHICNYCKCRYRLEVREETIVEVLKKIDDKTARLILLILGK